MFRPLALPVAAALAAAAPHARAEPQEIVPGATYELTSRPEVPARIHVVRVDLTASELTVAATAPDARGQTPGELAAALGAAVAVNGDAYSAVDFTPAGLAVGDGEVWPDTESAADTGILHIRRPGSRTEAAIAAPGRVQTANDLPPDTAGAVAGRPLLVDRGIAREDYDCGDPVAMPCERAPRTAVALSKGRTTLWIVTVDGWLPDSEGATASELAAALADLGAETALMLDGGSASALHVGPLGGVVSSPSDGAERRVANHLAVSFEALPHAVVTGIVGEREAFGGKDIPGATVTLDDGREATTDPDGNFTFDDVAPRRVCATARADGYEPATVCKQIAPGTTAIYSIALYPAGMAPDAGPPPDAAPPRPDAAPRLPDAAPAADADASAGSPGDSGGCRAAGRGHGPGFRVTLGALAAAWLVAAARRRLRR